MQLNSTGSSGCLWIPSVIARARRLAKIELLHRRALSRTMGSPVVFCSFNGFSCGILLLRECWSGNCEYWKLWQGFDEALESAFKIPMSKTFPPRRCFLTAQGVVSTINQRIGWEQIRPDNVIKGWKIGGQPDLPRRRWWPDEIGPRKRAWKSGRKRTRGWGWWRMDLLWIKLKLRIWGISYRKTWAQNVSQNPPQRPRTLSPSWQQDTPAIDNKKAASVPQDKQVQAWSPQGLCEEKRRVCCTAAQPFTFFDCLRRWLSLIFVSVQRLHCGCHKKLNTFAVTLVLATTPSPIDAFLVPCVNRHSFGSCPYKLHNPSNYDSSKKCSIEANTGSMCNDGQVMRHFCQ